MGVRQNSRPKMPVIVAEEHGVERDHAAHGVGMFHRPGKRERAAEIVRDQIERARDIGRGQKLLDELRHAVERWRVSVRHLRMAEAGQVRRDAAKSRAKPAGDVVPHDAAVGIAVQQQYRRPVAPFGDVDCGAADADVARSRGHLSIIRHRRLVTEQCTYATGRVVHGKGMVRAWRRSLGADLPLPGGER